MGGLSVKDNILVPEGMLRAAFDAVRNVHWQKKPVVEMALEAALRWLSENPILPEHDVYDEMIDDLGGGELVQLDLDLIAKWQRRMFYAKEG